MAETISYFRKLAQLLQWPGPPALAVLGFWQPFGLELDFRSLPELLERHGLQLD